MNEIHGSKFKRVMSKGRALINLAIFASGGGSNAQKIIEYFKDSKVVRVALVISNKPNAGVLAIARENGIPIKVIDRPGFYETEAILDVLKQHDMYHFAGPTQPINVWHIKYSARAHR